MSLTYSAGGEMPLPKLAWAFDGTTAPYIGTATASVTGTVTYVSGKYLQAISYTNSATGTPPDNYVSVSYTSGPFSLDSGFSYTVWVKINARPASGNRAFLTFNGSVTNYTSYLQYDDNIITTRYFNGSTTYIPTGSTYTVGEWIHLATTFVGGTMSFYINGAFFSSTPYTQIGSTLSSSFFIGRGGGLNDGSISTLDDLRIFDRALTGAQVRSIYNQQGMPGRGAFQNVVGSVKTSLTGTPLFRQLSSGVPSSVVAAFSLRAVNGTTVKAVQVSKTVAGAPTTVTDWPPIAFTGPTSSTAYGNFTASASSIYSAGYEAYLAFNKITVDTGGGGKSWVTNQSTTFNTNGIVGEWLQLQCPVALTLSTMILYGRTNDYGQNTTQIYLFGSNDGSTWTQLLGASATGLQSPGGGPTSFTVNAGAGYTYFRVVCTQPTGAALVAIGEMFVTGTIPNQTSSTQDFYADRLGNLLTAPVTGQSLANWLGGATGYVATWYDQSGSGNHATQATAANQPIIQRATKGPGYMLVYSGNQSLVGMSYTVLNNTNYYVNFIERRGINNSGELPVITSGSASGNGKVLILLYNNSTKFSHSQWGSEPTYSYGAAVPAYVGASEPIRYWSADFSQVSQEHLYLNGSLFATNSTQFAPLASTAGNFNIGNYPSSSSYYTGEIYEVLVFTQSLYDLDGTATVNQIYQNQLSYTGT